MLQIFLRMKLTILMYLSVVPCMNNAVSRSKCLTFECFTNGNNSSLNISSVDNLRLLNISWQYTNNSGYPFERNIFPCFNETEPHQYHFNFQCEREYKFQIIHMEMVMLDIWSEMKFVLHFEDGDSKDLLTNRTACDNEGSRRQSDNFTNISQQATQQEQDETRSMRTHDNTMDGLIIFEGVLILVLIALTVMIAILTYCPKKLCLQTGALLQAYRQLPILIQGLTVVILIILILEVAILIVIFQRQQTCSQTGILYVVRAFILPILLVLFIWISLMKYHNQNILLEKVIPAQFRKALTYKYNHETRTLVMECKLTRPNVPVCWQKDEQDIQNGGRFRISTDNCTHKLQIDNVASADNGTYACVLGEVKTKCPINFQELNEPIRCSLCCFQNVTRNRMSASVCYNRDSAQANLINNSH